MPTLPTELLNSIGVVLEVIVAVLTALLVAFWVGLAIWTLRDIRARTRDIFAWLLAALLVVIAGPLGLLLYLLMRPRETLAQVYDRQLEEEALLRDIATRRACPSCQTVTEAEWLVCPKCRTELRRQCSECAKPLELDWVACPYCMTPVDRKSPSGGVQRPSQGDTVSQSDQPQPESVAPEAPHRLPAAAALPVPQPAANRSLEPASE